MVNAFSTFNQTFSCKGPLVVPVQISFATSVNQIIDLTELIDRNAIDFISTVFIDLKGRVINVDLTSNDVPQTTHAVADSCGFYPVMCGNAPKFRALASAIELAPVTIIFSNIPYFPFIY